MLSDFRAIFLHVMMQVMTPKMAVRTVTSSTATTKMAAGRTKLLWAVGTNWDTTVGWTLGHYQREYWLTGLSWNQRIVGLSLVPARR